MKVPLTIGDYLGRAAAVYGDRTAVVDEPSTAGSLGALTYRELDSRVRGMALALDRMGVDQGERVAIVSPNAARFLISYFGVSAYGRILVPVNYRLNADEIGYIIDHSGTSVLLVDPESQHSLRGIGAKYNSLGGPSSFLGLPTTDELGMPGGRVSYFQHGWIAWTPGGGAYAG